MLPTRMAGMGEGGAGGGGGGGGGAGWLVWGIYLLAQEELLYYPRHLHPHLC